MVPFITVSFGVMDTKPCLNCGDPVPQTPGKRERKFCSDECRQKKWQKDQQAVRKQLKGLKEDHFQATGPATKAVMVPEMPPYERYKYDIDHAGSIDEIKKLVRLGESDNDLAGWQKEQVKKLGIAKSQTLDI